MARRRRGRGGRFVRGSSSFSRPAPSGRGRRAYSAMRRAGSRVYSFVAPRAAQAAKDKYVMGIVPKIQWGAWVVQQVAQPLLSGGQGWDATKGQPFFQRLNTAWTMFYDNLNIRASGYQPSAGAFAPADHPAHPGATYKEMIGPGITTFGDWLQSRFTGRMGRRLRLAKGVQMIGSK